MTKEIKNEGPEVFRSLYNAAAHQELETLSDKGKTEMDESRMAFLFGFSKGYTTGFIHALTFVKETSENWPEGIGLSDIKEFLDLTLSNSEEGRQQYVAEMSKMMVEKDVASS